jgi:hypothetical protein
MGYGESYRMLAVAIYADFISVIPDDGLDRHVLQLQWRSPCGTAVTLERATVDVRYQSASANC